MSIDVKYTISSTATGGGRDGHVTSSAGYVDLDLRPPQALGGSGKAANPEELFSAGYAACFLGALHLVAQRKNITLPKETTVTVTIGIGHDPVDDGFGLVANIQASIPDIDKAIAEQLAEAAHNFCPYSKATKGNITHSIQVTV